MKKFLFGALLLIFLMPGTAFAYTYDLGIESSDIFFSQDTDHLISGTSVRIYARINNLGEEDVAASVVFYNGPSIIDESQLVSVRSGGLSDEVYVDWVVPNGSFNIVAQIKAPDPGDQNLLNNQAMTPLITPLKDTDGDGIADIDDDDDDNDGLSDEDEHSAGTDQTVADSDGDGVNDGDDAYPADPSRTELETQTAITDDDLNIDNNDDETQDEQTGDDTNDDQNADSGDAEQTNNNDKSQTTSSSNSVDEEEDEIVEYDTEQYNKLQTMPGFEMLSNVQIQATQTGWGEYEFNFVTNAQNINPDELIFEWSYGDGESSKENIAHQYTRAGKYYAKLKVLGPFQNTLNDVVTINVPFWSVQNYTMWGLVAFLILAFIVLLLSGRKKKTEE